MRLELDTEAVDLAPGAQVTVGVTVVNDGAAPIDVVLGIAGLDNDGVRPVAQLGVVPAGGSAVTTLHFALPKGAVAGLRQVAIHADAGPERQTARLAIRVLSTERLSLSLQRNEVRGRFRGRLRANLRNQGVEPLTVRLWGEGDDVDVRFERDTITLPPGHATRVKGRVKLPGVSMRGEQRRAFVVTAQGASTPATTSGSYVQRGVLPASLFTLVAILVVLALWAVGLIYVQNRLRDDGDDTAAVTTTTGTTPDTTPGGGTTPGGTTPGGTTPDGSPGGSVPPDGSVPPGQPSGGSSIVPVSIIGAVDGPVTKQGTTVVLELISSGPSDTVSGLRTKVAPFASVRQATSAVTETQRTTTDGNGKFRFDNITVVPALYRLTLFRTGFDVASQVVNVDGKQPNIDLTIKLSPAAGVLGGRALDAGGAALGGVQVSVESGDLRYATTTADGTGQWRLEGVSTPGTYVIQFAKAGYASATLIETLDGGGTSTGLEVRMVEGLGTVRGRVVVGLEGIGGLTVTLSDGTRKLVTTTRTDDPVGFFEFPGIPLGVFSLTIEGEGWQTSARQVTLSSGLEDLGVITDLLRSTATIRGVVTQEAIDTASTTCVVPLAPGLPGARQQPCGGVGITASQGTTTFRTTSATGDGSFLLAGIPPGTYTLTFERFGYTSVVFAVTVMLGDNVTVDPVRLFVLPRDLEASGILRLRVRSLDPTLPLEGTAQVLGQLNEPTAYSGPANATADFNVPNLLPGSYRVRVMANGHDDGFAVVQIPLNAESAVYDVDLVPLGTVTGAITNDLASAPPGPVAGAVVLLTPVDDTTGRLLIPPPGTPINPSTEYLRDDPAVGEVRLCEKDVSEPGQAATFVRGLCTRTDAGGVYRFANSVREGTYRVSTPRNEAGGSGSEVPLDHRAQSIDIGTALNQTTTANLELRRLGAIVTNISTVDAATGSAIAPLDLVTVTAYFCEPAATDLGCAVPSSGGAFAVPRGRLSSPQVGTVRVDRLAPAGLDPVTGVTVGHYLLRLERDGFVTEFLRVPAPALDTDVVRNVVMLPKPVQVRITPYWTKAGTTTPQVIPDASVTFTGIVGYTDAQPPVAITDSVTDSTPDADGRFDSGTMLFRAGEVEVEISAPGFATVTTFVTLDENVASGAEIEDLTFAVDPTDSERILASARVRLPAVARSVSGTLTAVCCTPTDTFVPSNVTEVYAALTARLTLVADSGVTFTSPVGAGGAYTFAGVTPGDYAVSFEVGTNTIGLAGNIDLPTSPVDVGFVANTTIGALKAVLTKGTLSGVVTDTDDDVPLADATVTIKGTSTSTVTDGDGRYSLDIADVPGTVDLVITKDDERDDCEATSPQVNPGASVVFPVSCVGPRGAIEGVVLGRDHPTATPTGLEGVDVVLRRVGSTEVFASTVTESDGSYRFEGIPAGTTGSRDYTLEVSKDAYDVLAAVTVTVQPRLTTDVDDLVLTASTRTVPIEVLSETPLGDDEVPLGGVTVLATRSGFSPVSQVTDADGLVSLALAPGDWVITTTGASGATARLADLSTVVAPHLDHGGDGTTVTVPVGTGSIDATQVSLEGPFGSASGTVKGRLNPGTTPTPLGGAKVTIVTSRGTVEVFSDDTTGEFLFDATIPVGFAAATVSNLTVTATSYDTFGPSEQSIELGATVVVTAIPEIVLAASAQNASILVRGRESQAALKDVVVTASLVGHPSTSVEGPTGVGGTTTLALVPGTWTLTTSNGANALAGATAAPHGDVIGSVTVVLGTAPAQTVLEPAALVSVSGAVTSTSTGDVGTFPSRELSGASITATRVGVATPAEPVNSFSTLSSGGDYSLLLTPGTWDIEATAAGHDPVTITRTVVAATPITDADLDLSEQPIFLSGTVYTAGDVAVPGVTVTFTSGGQSGSTVTAGDGTYEIELAASQEWEVGFDASTATVAMQDIPVLYRYVGTAQGGTVVVLDHRLFAEVVSLAVTVKGVLATQCDETSCVEHDLGTAATVTLTDKGNDAPDGRQVFVVLDPIDTVDTGGTQVALFAEVPDLSSFTLGVSAPGYAAVEIDPLDLDTAQCDPAVAGARCITVRLNAEPRDVEVTVTDVSGSPVQGATALIRSKPPATDVSQSCLTDTDGVCTVPGLQPAFSPYGIYELAITPLSADTRGHYVQDLVLPPGVGTFEVTVDQMPIKPVVTTHPSAVTEWAGESVSFTAVATGDPTPSVAWEKVPAGGGTPVAITTGIVNTEPSSGERSSTLTITTAAADNGATFRAVFSNQVNPASNVNSVTSNGAVLTTAAVDPAFPVDALVFSGDNFSFTATRTGAATTVQWQRNTGTGFANLSNGGGVSGATATTLSINNAGSGSNATGTTYRAVVTLPGASATRTTRAATLTAVSEPTNPANTTVWEGTAASFSITVASGLAVQWQIDPPNDGSNAFTNISGATSASLTVSSVTAAMAGTRYRAVVTAPGPTTSSPKTTSNATLSVRTVTETPQNVTQWSGQNATFCANHDGGGGVSYAWQRDLAGGAEEWVAIGGATGKSLTIPATTGANGDRFRVVISTSTGAVFTSDPATLTVATITTNPSNVLVWDGNPVTFTAAASVTADVQWERDAAGGATTFVAISGATGTSYTIPAGSVTASLDGDAYRAVFSLTNTSLTGGSVVSNATTSAATLTVARITTQPANSSVTAGASATFSVAVTGGTPTVQWQMATAAAPTVFSNISGATSTSLTVSSTTVAMSGNRYRAVLTLSGATPTTKNSSEAVLTVTAPGP